MICASFFSTLYIYLETGDVFSAEIQENKKRLTFRFQLVILSNNFKKEVIPFKEQLCVDASYFSCKPLKRKYKKVLSIYELKPSEVACIGDQMLFDVWGANRMGLTSILVNPISLEEIAFNRIGRKLENFIMNQLTKKDLFKKGRYYE